MEAIIITALVSVFVTLVVGYFIWSAIGVRKLKKQVKSNIEDITIIFQDIRNHYDLIHDLNNQQNVQINDITNTILNEIKSVDESLKISLENETTDIRQIYNDLCSYVENKDTELHRELDKRFDKVYQAISETKK
jgi:predicted PurR-regulated permease PerM